MILNPPKNAYIIKRYSGVEGKKPEFVESVELKYVYNHLFFLLFLNF